MAKDNDESSNSGTKSGKGPIVVDLGRFRKKQIKRLFEGRGRLMSEVNDCLEELASSGQISESAQTVVVVVKQRNARRDRLCLPTPRI